MIVASANIVSAMCCAGVHPTSAIRTDSSRASNKPHGYASSSGHRRN